MPNILETQTRKISKINESKRTWSKAIYALLIICRPRRQLTTSNKKRKYDSNRHSAEHKFKNSFYTHQPIFHPPASVVGQIH